MKPCTDTARNLLGNIARGLIFICAGKLLGGGLPRWRQGDAVALGAAGELGLDALDDAALGRLVRHTDAVIDGAVVGGAVADDANAAHAEQMRAAVLAVVEALAEFIEGLAARAARPPER